jgi:uncharacterized protein YqgV (UPF0045/DUF77 family)
MNTFSAQISLYPLGEVLLSPAIDATLRILREHGLDVEPGMMSSLISGEEAAIFAGLQEAFHQIAAEGRVVLVVTLSNACPTKE